MTTKFEATEEMVTVLIDELNKRGALKRENFKIALSIAISSALKNHCINCGLTVDPKCGCSTGRQAPSDLIRDRFESWMKTHLLYGENKFSGNEHGDGYFDPIVQELWLAYLQQPTISMQQTQQDAVRWQTFVSAFERDDHDFIELLTEKVNDVCEATGRQTPTRAQMDATMDEMIRLNKDESK